MYTVKNIAIKRLIQVIGMLFLMGMMANKMYAQSTVASSEDPVGTFRVIAYQDNAQSVESVSNTTQLRKSTSLHVPTAFTPDADGVNDQFGAKGINVRDFHMEIFNRWGEKIYESDDINAHWDGTFQGQAAQQGSYVFHVTAFDIDTNEDISTTGTVALLR